jgi:hypothetical protein
MTYPTTNYLDTQLLSIYSTTLSLFLGNTVVFSNGYMTDNTPAGQPSFVEKHAEAHFGDLGIVSEFSWGDVLKGMEEISHNVTAALLTLQLGTMSAKCFFDYQVVVYRYRSFALWVPYSVGPLLFPLML